MEQDNKKRVREGDHDHHDQDQKDHSKRHAKNKQQQDYGLLDIIDDFQDDQYKTLGVFDFPWLKDGVVSKSEDGWKLEDVFSSPLEETSTVTTTIAGIEFSFSGHECLCQATPETLLDLPEDKFEETESVDCIWSSLLNQPLQQPN